MLSILTLIAAQPAATDAPPAAVELVSPAEFHLLCHGTGQNQVATTSSGVGFFKHLALAFGSSTQVQNFDDDVRVDIQGNTPRITLPGRFLAAIHRTVTTYTITPLAIDDDAISGKISINWANHPNFRINRHTGVIEVDGSLGHFTGKCEKTDPDQRAF